MIRTATAMEAGAAVLNTESERRSDPALGGLGRSLARERERPARQRDLDASLVPDGREHGSTIPTRRMSWICAAWARRMGRQ